MWGGGGFQDMPTEWPYIRATTESMSTGLYILCFVGLVRCLTALIWSQNASVLYSLFSSIIIPTHLHGHSLIDSACKKPAYHWIITRTLVHLNF